MAAPGALSSDHVNYLIFRYLQESGHEKTAAAFHQDWYRPREYREPEDLPFAQAVHRAELVSVIQNGLTYDELQARVGRNERRFRWTMGDSVGPRESVEDDGMAGETEHENGSRPPSSGKRKGRAPPVGGMRAPDEFPTPAPKRQRVSHETESVHVNGDRDAMDVDATSASPADAESTANEEESAAAESDFDVPAERYDSMDVATQTEVRAGPKTSTISFTVSKPGARILHSSWCPTTEEGDKGTLLTVGEDLCRYYSIPELLDGDLKTIPHVDEPSLPANSVVTATAWHPNGHSATCAINSIRELIGDKQTSTHTLMDIGQGFGTAVYPQSPHLLDPPGIATNIRYSPAGTHILVAKSNLKRSVVEIYETRADPSKPHLRLEPVAWRIFEHQALDAAWRSEENFIVCGDNNLLRNYTLALPEAPTTNGFTPSSIALHNLTEESLEPSAANHIDTLTRWDQLRHDTMTSTTIVSSSGTTRVLLIRSAGPRIIHADQKAGLVALAVSSNKPWNPSLLRWDNGPWNYWATAGAGGVCELSVLHHDGSGDACTERLGALKLGEDALAIAFSAGGKFFAAAGTEVVRVWRVEPVYHGDMEEWNLEKRPLATWQVKELGSEDGLQANGEEAVGEPSLSWSPDGGRLSFVLDKQVSVISFRPPLSSELAEQVNGGASP